MSKISPDRQSLALTAEGKVMVCHVPQGNPDNVQLIDVSNNALEKHQGHHGDYIGACGAPAIPGCD